MGREKILLGWSSGKDSALAFYQLQKSDTYEVMALLTTVSKEHERISMHGTREVLLDQQAASLDIPLAKVYVSRDHSTPMQEYEAKMQEALLKYQRLGISRIAFGDLYLEDIKNYRKELLGRIDMSPILPLWGQNTTELANNFIELGFKAIITCVDTTMLDKQFSGRYFDKQLLSELPAKVDPCGENGEFHTFVFDGPIFNDAVKFIKGDFSLRDNRFYSCDLVPVP